MKELLELSKKERTQYLNEATARSEKIKNPIVIEKGNPPSCRTLSRYQKNNQNENNLFQFRPLTKVLKSTNKNKPF
jgi:hypothetical protein